MKVGLCTIAYQELPLEEALDRAAAIQFDGVELWGKPPHLPAGAGEAEGRAIGEAIRERGLEAAVFGSYLRAVEEPFAPAADALLAVARGLGAPLVRVWAADRGSDRADDDLYALTARTYQKANKMLDLPWAMLLGATVVKKDTWEKIPADVRPQLLEISKSYGRRISLDVRKMNDEAIASMKSQGLTVIKPENLDAWKAAAEKANKVVRGGVVPAAIYDEVIRLRDEFRAGKK